MVFRSRYNVRGEFEILPDSCSNPNHYTNQQGRFEEEVEAGMRDDLERMTLQHTSLDRINIRVKRRFEGGSRHSR